MIEGLSKHFKSSLPWIVLIIGLFAFGYATFGTFENEQWKIFWHGIGQAFIAGGIFSLLLKTFQLMGVFKDELIEVIYEGKFLRNRKDLSEVWEKVSNVMFKNKFPKISKEITNDVRDIYFPTEQVLYYDNYKQVIEIELLEDDKIKVTQKSDFTIFPTEISVKIPFKSQNAIKFKNAEDVYFKVNYLKVNSQPVAFKITQEKIDSTLKSMITYDVKSCEEYRFEIEVEKSYFLKDDNFIGFQKSQLIHDLNVKITLKGDLKFDFQSSGTLKQFKPVMYKNENIYEFDYKGIIYPKQGYMIFVTKK